MLCTSCKKEEVPEGRLRKLGLTTCLICADIAAQEEIKAKGKRVSLAYNKGPYMYVGPADSAKANLMERVEHRRTTPAPTELAVVRVAVANNKSVVKQARKPLGIYWQQGEHPPRGGTVFYDENDPELAKAIRIVRT